MQRIHNLLSLGWFLFFRDFQYRFKYTYFGYIWAISRPLLVGIPIILAGKSLNFAGDMSTSINYEMYALSGILFFQMFWNGVEFPQMLLWRGRMIIKNTHIRHEAVIIASCCYITINVAVYIALIIAAAAYFGMPLHTSALFTLFSIPALLVSGLAIGILIAPFSLLYLDLRYGISILSGVLMWATPILYVAPKGGLLSNMNKWNPLTYLIETPRYWLIGGTQPDKTLFLISLIFFFIIFFAAIRFYRRAIPVLAEAIL